MVSNALFINIKPDIQNKREGVVFGSFTLPLLQAGVFKENVRKFSGIPVL